MLLPGPGAGAVCARSVQPRLACGAYHRLMADATTPTPTAGADEVPQVEDQADGRARWAAAYAAAEAAGGLRDADFTTLSGTEVEPVYGPPKDGIDPRMERIGWP